MTAVIENLEILLQCIKIIKVSNDLLLNLTSVLLTSLFAFLFLAFCYFTFKTFHCCSEEVAFYNGSRKEQSILLSSFRKLVDHIRSFIQFRFYMGLVDNIVAKCRYYTGPAPPLSACDSFVIPNIDEGVTKAL